MLLTFILKLIEFLFLLILLVGVPALAMVTMRQKQLRTVPRSALYLSAVFSQWVLGAVTVLVVVITGTRFVSLGFRAVGLIPFLGWALAAALVAVALTGVLILLEKLGWWPPESELLHLLIPSNTREKLLCVFVVAPTAALCEEFIYRGYLLTQLGEYLNSTPRAWALSSFVFGLAHVYQGWSGMLRAALLGALLAYPVVKLGSLYPSMAAHWLIDVVAFVWLGPRFLPRVRARGTLENDAAESGSSC